MCSFQMTSKINSVESALSPSVAELVLVRPVRSIFCFLMLAVCSVAMAQATKPSPTGDSSSKHKALAIVRPQPRYPVDSLGRHPTGHGIVVVEVDQKTGWVTSAKIEKSSGSKLLDEAALDAFRRWRFRPGSKPEIHMPFNYTKGANAR